MREHFLQKQTLIAQEDLTGIHVSSFCITIVILSKWGGWKCAFLYLTHVPLGWWTPWTLVLPFSANFLSGLFYLHLFFYPFKITPTLPFTPLPIVIVPNVYLSAWFCLKDDRGGSLCRWKEALYRWKELCRINTDNLVATLPPTLTEWCNTISHTNICSIQRKKWLYTLWYLTRGRGGRLASEEMNSVNAC